MADDLVQFTIADFVWEMRFDVPCGGVNLDLFRQFVSERDSAADVELTIHHGVVPESRDGLSQILFDCTDAWRLFRDGTRYRLELWFGATVEDMIRGRVAEWDEALGTGDVYLDASWMNWAREDSRLKNPLDYPMAHVLMVLMLARERGAFIHASGIDDNGRGYLFAGNSGQGKSTMARQWKDRGVLLNDDRMVIRKREGQYWIYGTPWHGELPDVSPGGVPLDKVFLLRHGDENRVQPVRGAGAVGKLLARCFPPLWDAEGMRFTLDFLGGLVEQCPVYELSFVPDKRVVDLVRCVS